MTRPLPEGIPYEVTIRKRTVRRYASIAYWQRAQARRTPGSRGWWEAQRRVVGLRNNAHHQLSRLLVRKYAVLAVETLNVAGMIKAELQSRALADAGMSSLLVQIQYKASWYGTRLVEADQWYPSSKTCSDCGMG